MISTDCRKCAKSDSCYVDDITPCFGYEPKKLTNADRIRSMTDEELAEWLGDMIYPECPCCPADDNGWCEDCHERWLDWLKKEAEADADKEGE